MLYGIIPENLAGFVHSSYSEFNPFGVHNLQTQSSLCMGAEEYHPFLVKCFQWETKHRKQTSVKSHFNNFHCTNIQEWSSLIYQLNVQWNIYHEIQCAYNYMHDKNTITFFYVIILKEQTMHYSYKCNIQQESRLILYRLCH